MAYPLLSTVHSPEDLKTMDFRELERLCAEIREFLIEKVSRTGGHLSSNLGVIELTVALHRCLFSPQDQFVFDVGHQCYTHKLLTGRRAAFDELRLEGGLSGFPAPEESCHDAFGTGHGSTAVSAAIGLAYAKKLAGKPGLVVAVVGDGAFTGGMAYEGFNNAGGLDNLVIILNDNSMSISKNVGVFAHYLTRLRTNPAYYHAKRDVKQVLDRTPVIGEGMVKGIQGVKTALRRGIYHSTLFEEMGLYHIGPLNGHDLPALCGLFSNMAQLHKPLLLHVETKKGKGFVPAERNPGAFHGVSAFNAHSAAEAEQGAADSFSSVFGRELAALAAKDARVCGITAAMKYGTGLQYLKKSQPARFFDVGMAEEHAVTFAAGLAAGGQKPVVAIYSTFLQRAYDQIIHDVVLGRQNVLFAVDRAGLVPGDGRTHQGIFDAAFLSQCPGLFTVSPANYAELRFWLRRLLLEENGPCAIRYPRGAQGGELARLACSGSTYDKLTPGRRAKTAIVSYGVLAEEALRAAELLRRQKLPVSVYKLLVINPLPGALVLELAGCETVLFAEDGVVQGGIGEHLALQIASRGFKGRFIHRAVTDVCVDHATVPQLRRAAGLSAEALAAALLEDMKT